MFSSQVSIADNVIGDFVTPLGDFMALKKEGEDVVLRQNTPRVSPVVLRMARYDDNFVEEDLDITYTVPAVERGDLEGCGDNKIKINRRDAARAVVDALIEDDWRGKRIDVSTVER